MKHVISVSFTAAVWWCYRKIYIGFTETKDKLTNASIIDISMNTEYSA